MTAVTVTQQQVALGLANHARLAMSEVRRELRAGELALAPALFDERAGPLTIHTLLASQRRWGNIRSTRLLAGLDPPIRETKLVRDLTTRQRVIIIEAVGGIHR